MAQSDNGYELYCVCEAVSIGSGADTRTLTIMERSGTEDDPYGGFTQRELLTGVEVSEVPDGMNLKPEHHPAYGFDTDRRVAIYIRGSDPQVVTVAWHDGGA